MLLNVTSPLNFSIWFFWLVFFKREREKEKERKNSTGFRRRRRKKKERKEGKKPIFHGSDGKIRDRNQVDLGKRIFFIKVD